jgi:hypothetical protein
MGMQPSDIELDIGSANECHGCHIGAVGEQLAAHAQ